MQSIPLRRGRAELEERAERLERQYADESIPVRAVLCCAVLCRAAFGVWQGWHVPPILGPSLALACPQVPRPPHWGGFLLRPLSVEFWQVGASLGSCRRQLLGGDVMRGVHGCSESRNHSIRRAREAFNTTKLMFLSSFQQHHYSEGAHCMHHTLCARRAAPPACTTACATCGPMWTRVSGAWSAWRLDSLRPRLGKASRAAQVFSNLQRGPECSPAGRAWHPAAAEWQSVAGVQPACLAAHPPCMRLADTCAKPCGMLRTVARTCYKTKVHRSRADCSPVEVGGKVGRD